MTDTIDAAGIVAAICKPLGPWTEGKHYGTSGRTIQAIGIFGKCEVTTGWENGKASAHRAYTETTWHDDEAAAIAFLNDDYRARIVAALDVGPILALVGAAKIAKVQLEMQSQVWADDLGRTLAVFKEASHG